MHKGAIMNRQVSFGAAFMAALFLFSGTAASKEPDPLYLYVAPSKGGKPGGGRPAGADPASGHDHGSNGAGGTQKKEGGKPSQYGGGKAKGSINIEPSMRPMPKRSYVLSSSDISVNASAYLVLADGTLGKISLSRDEKEAKVEFETPVGDGPAHGANNVYVVDKKVAEGTLYVRTAKWISMHHSCGWGHDYKYNEERTAPRVLADIPLDLKVGSLWSGNFHDNVYSGDMIEIEAFNYGRPAAGTNISVTTDEKWTKRLRTDDAGKTSFRLIEDYFSDDWSRFNRGDKRAFSLVANYEAIEEGEYNGEKYEKVKMTTTLHWKYSPGKKGYESYSAGLYAGIFTIGIGGLGIYFHRSRKKNPLSSAALDEED